MSKRAFVFPGQGSQVVGMGKDLIKNYKEADELFDESNIALKDEGIDLKKLCLDGPEEDLTKTINTQPAILTVSIISYDLALFNLLPFSVLDGAKIIQWDKGVFALIFSFTLVIWVFHPYGIFWSIF